MSGFTLLEILVAVAVFAIFSAMAYGGLMRLLDNRTRIDAERAFWRDTAIGFRRMEEDFSLARNRPIRDNDGTVHEGAQFLGQPTDLRAMAAPSVEFTRGGIFVPNGSTADLQRVGYQLVDGNVVRLSWPVLDRAPLTKPAAVPIFRDVTEFEVRFCQDAACVIDRWPPLATGGNPTPLPGGVQVTIAFKERGKFVRRFVVVGGG
jgi:general secretion pathway protein J